MSGMHIGTLKDGEGTHTKLRRLGEMDITVFAVHVDPPDLGVYMIKPTSKEEGKKIRNLLNIPLSYEVKEVWKEEGGIPPRMRDLGVPFLFEIRNIKGQEENLKRYIKEEDFIGPTVYCEKIKTRQPAVYGFLYAIDRRILSFVKGRLSLYSKEVNCFPIDEAYKMGSIR